MNDEPKKSRPASGSLTQEAYLRIRAEILSCKLKPEQKLVIQEICDSLGFSLGAVREALSRLAAEGLVESQPRIGFRVTPVTLAELKDITAVRTKIETECLEGAIRFGDLQWEADIVSLQFQLSKIPVTIQSDPSQLNQNWAETHRRFHFALVSACGSPWLLRLRETLYLQSERYRWMSKPRERGLRNLQAEHEAIANATVARDAQTACRLISEHIGKTTKILIESGNF